MIDKINDSMLVPADWESTGAIIKVIGIGGGGNNAVNNMFHTGIEGVHFVACNTDVQALRLSPLDTKIQLSAQGLGAGCYPDRGKQAAEESMNKINEVLDNNTQMVFLTAGMGGGTGTGATPVIAKAAKEKGILTVAVVTMPFSDEGLDYTMRAREGVLELQKYVDSLLVINNDRLYELYGTLPLRQAFAKADGVLTTAVKGISEIITHSGYINVDFADVRRAMENSNVAVMGSGSASGEGRALRAAEEALSSPLLNYDDISGARSVLVNITASDDTLMAGELREAMDYIQKCTGGMAKFVKRGVVYDNTLGDMIHITVVATGFPMPPFIDVPVTQEGRVIVLGDDKPSEVAVGSEQSAVSSSSRQSAVVAGIEVDDRRRVFEEVGSSSRQLAVGNPLPKPALILDENTDEESLRRVPAYLRRKVAISTPADHNDATASTLTSTSAGGHRLSSDNAYLHQHLD
jgi:cell division protein FtsZ